MNDEMISIKKGAAMTYFKVLYWSISGETGKTMKIGLSD
jgi:hypothetical protein